MGLFSNTATIVAQASDPGPLGPGAFWSDTDDQVTYRRNDANTQWVPVGAKVGDILMWGGTEVNAPTGFAICDGTAISRTDFGLLFDIIGTTFGNGDGSTTFNLPDLQTSNRFPRAATNDGAVGDTGGESTHAITEAELAVHTHVYSMPNNTILGDSVTSDYVSGPVGQKTVKSDDSPLNNAMVIADTGSGTAHENKPPFIDFHYIISTGL